MNLFGIEIGVTHLWLLSVAGVCVAWLVVHRLAVGRERASRQAAACAAFRSALLTALGSIYPTPNPWPENITVFLKSRFDALQTATQVFRPFVRDKVGFDAAWLRYFSAYPTKTSEQCYHHYMSAYDPLIGTQQLAENKARSEFHKNVSALLRFADERPGR